jgi:hypothetical protein
VKNRDGIFELLRHDELPRADAAFPRHFSYRRSTMPATNKGAGILCRLAAAEREQRNLNPDPTQIRRLSVRRR